MQQLNLFTGRRPDTAPPPLASAPVMERLGQRLWRLNGTSNTAVDVLLDWLRECRHNAHPRWISLVNPGPAQRQLIQPLRDARQPALILSPGPRQTPFALIRTSLAQGKSDVVIASVHDCPAAILAVLDAIAARGHCHLLIHDDAHA